MSTPPRRQHVVSETILKRWSIAGEVVAVDLRNGRFQRRSPSAEAFEEWLVREVYARPVEAVWGEVETDVPQLLDALDGGRPLTPELRRVLTRLVSLHLVRSRGFQQMNARVIADSAAAGGRLHGILTWFGDDQVVAMLAQARTGLIPAGPEGLALAREREIRRLADEFEPGGRFFVDQILVNFERAAAMLSDMRIEIGRVVEGELVIADNPAVPHNPVTRASGFLNGARIGEGPVMMPLTPHLIAVVGGGVEGDTTLDGHAVEVLNRIQISNAVKKVYATPGSDAHQWILGVREELLSVDDA